ncbi:MAG: class I SAM-dependent methyltransferase [Acidobacteriaceae bacterium]|nr:class I SAM-dependent methyltransferase [Acidobacteriaceae bacterium]
MRFNPFSSRRAAPQPESAQSSYDEIAEMYHALWADWYLPAALPALEKLFFSKLRPGSRVLDLCCGSGHVTRELIARGHRVTGVDSSAALTVIARRELPHADWLVCDARSLRFNTRFEGVLSTFDSLNHILTLDELRLVFRGVRAALKPGGLFVFDMNLEEAYSLDLHQWTVNISESRVGLVRGVYDSASKLATTELIWFRKTSNGLWRRHASVVRERCYPVDQILDALAASGFHAIEAIPAPDAGIVTDLGFGRVFFSARAQV